MLSVDLYLYGLPSNNTTTNGGDAVGLFYSINLQLSTRYLRLDIRRSVDLYFNNTTSGVRLLGRNPQRFTWVTLNYNFQLQPYKARLYLYSYRLIVMDVV